jgi:hypothetical protein
VNRLKNKAPGRRMATNLSALDSYWRILGEVFFDADVIKNVKQFSSYWVSREARYQYYGIGQ